LPLSIREDQKLSPPEMPSIEGNRIPVPDLVSHEGVPTRPFVDIATSPPRLDSRRFFARCLPSALRQLRHRARPPFTTHSRGCAVRRFFGPERRASTSATYPDARARCIERMILARFGSVEASSCVARFPSVARRRATSRMNPGGESHGAGIRRRRSSFRPPPCGGGIHVGRGTRVKGCAVKASYPPRANPSSVRVTASVGRSTWRRLSSASGRPRPPSNDVPRRAPLSVGSRRLSPSRNPRGSKDGSLAPVWTDPPSRRLVETRNCFGGSRLCFPSMSASP
jgi:hypothetical protein